MVSQSTVTSKRPPFKHSVVGLATHAPGPPGAMKGSRLGKETWKAPSIEEFTEDSAIVVRVVPARPSQLSDDLQAPEIDQGAGAPLPVPPITSFS